MFQYSSDSLNSFVNSAINIEYVYLILTGISGFMNENLKRMVQEQEASNRKGKKNEIKIDMLEILHKSNWDIENKGKILDEKTGTEVDTKTNPLTASKRSFHAGASVHASIHALKESTGPGDHIDSVARAARPSLDQVAR